MKRMNKAAIALISVFLSVFALAYAQENGTFNDTTVDSPDDNQTDTTNDTTDNETDDNTTAVNDTDDNVTDASTDDNVTDDDEVMETTGDNETTVELQVMKHLCNPSIQSREGLENSPNIDAACPAIEAEDDDGDMLFELQVLDSEGIQDLEDAELESDSSYTFDVTTGTVTVEEIDAEDSELGLARYTDENDTNETTIEPDDDLVTITVTEGGILHLYNFQDRPVNVSGGNQTNQTNQTDDNDTVVDDDDEDFSEYTRAFYGHGWALSDDGGYLVQALWFRDTDSDFQDNEEDISSIAGGIMKLDVGEDAMKIRLEKTNSMEDTIAFEVTSSDDDAEEQRLGTLTVVRVPHTDVTMWQGLLELDAGNRQGSYHVEIGTRSVVVEDLEGVTDLVEQQNEIQIEEEEGFLQGLLNRLFRRD